MTSVPVAVPLITSVMYRPVCNVTVRTDQCRASDFPFQKKQFSVSKKAIFRFKKREIPFQFRFIIAKIEFDEITIYPKKVFHRI